MKVAFIGLGIMGSRMAQNLLHGGCELTVFNRTPGKAESLLSDGAAWAASPAEAAQKAEVLITMLATPDAVRQTAVGENGFLAALQPGSVWIDCSTVNPSFSRSMADEAAGRQIHFLDAPVAGSKEPAAKGELMFLAGGEQQILARCQPLFDSMGRKVVHVGGNGAGSSLKMLINLLLAQAMLAFSEALSLGRAMGFEEKKLLEVLQNSPVVAPFLAGKTEKIANNDYEADFPLKWMHKDLHLVATTAYENSVALPLGNVAKEIFAMAVNAGLADSDFSAICRYLQS